MKEKEFNILVKIEVDENIDPDTVDMGTNHKYEVTASSHIASSSSA